MFTIEEIRGLANPLKSYMFKMQIQPVRGNAGALSEAMAIQCISTIFPGSSMDVVTRALGGHQVHYAGRRTYSGNWTTSLAETVRMDIIRRIYSWQQLCFNSATGLAEAPDGYKSNALVELVDEKNRVNLIRRIIGIFPREVSDLQMTNESSDGSNIEVTWSYDYYEDNNTSR